MAALEADPNSTNSHFIIDHGDRDHDTHAHEGPDPLDDDDDDADTASARSISLSSPAASPRHSNAFPDSSSTREDKRESHPYTISTESSDPDDRSDYTAPSSVTSATPSAYAYDAPKTAAQATYPPPPSNVQRESVASFATSASSVSKKARPESMLMQPPTGPLVLGIALVDFNHQVGPRIEFSKGAVFDDEEIAKIMPFLALPDGAHLSVEDYSYFHLVPSSPNPTTIFGISCNRQIATSSLLVKEVDMTRSTVQKAVVVLASKPVFGPIRDRLGVVTRALFEQRDFRETGILVDFYESLELSLRSQLTESGLYMGTSLRELVREFRQRTLLLVKALILQKKIMFYGHPVERLCTYQYSLISLIPGLLQTLDDCGSPPLASRAPTLSRPNSLKTSDRKSLLAYLGLPLDLFGKDAFFQPYLPLQQLDLIKSQTKSYLCGSTNSIVTQQKDIDLLVNVETGAVEFRDARLERTIALTAADRKWMDEIVHDVNNGWEDEMAGRGMQRFKGSDDYLRIKFEEYISAALASVKYADFMAKGEGSGVLITPGSGSDPNSMEDFNTVWIAEFKRTNAFEVWQRITDPMLFDIIEPRHPCTEKPSAIADISLRLSEGIQELKLDQQLAPTREAISRTLTAGSTGFFKVVEGMRGRWAQRSTSPSNPPVDSSPSDSPKPDTPVSSPPPPVPVKDDPSSRPASVTSTTAGEAKERVGSWGVGIGSFFSSRASRFSTSKPAENNPPLPVPPPKDIEKDRDIVSSSSIDTTPSLTSSPAVPAASTISTMTPIAAIAVPSVVAVGGVALDNVQEAHQDEEKTRAIEEETHTEQDNESLSVYEKPEASEAEEDFDSSSLMQEVPIDDAYDADITDEPDVHPTEAKEEHALWEEQEDSKRSRHGTPRSMALSLEAQSIGSQDYEPFGVAL